MLTTIDSDRLVYKIRESGPKLSIGNKFYSVVFKQDSFSSKDPFGNQYYFYLKESIGNWHITMNKPIHVPEYLVNFDTLDQVA